MILSDLLRVEVRDHEDRRLGRIVDVRFRLEGSANPSRARMVGIIVSPRTASSFLGYERASLSQPVILARILAWVHRGSFLVAWSDIQRIDTDVVRLRPRYERLLSTLED